MPLPIQWGIENEDVARDQYKKTFGLEVEETGLTLHNIYSFLGASSDGKVRDPSLLPIENQTGVLEIKCPYSINSKLITHSTGEDLLSTPGFYMGRKDGAPFLNREHKYYAQVQGEMAILGLSWCDFFVWTGASENNYLLERIFFYEEYVKIMIHKIVNFYFKHIFPKVMRLD